MNPQIRDKFYDDFLKSTSSSSPQLFLRITSEHSLKITVVNLMKLILRNNG